jgi:D-psicose/D-tagatose/L-ribulose 3-epimerase
MFSADNDLASNRALCRQAVVDYLRREIPLTKEIGGSYLLVILGAVGRPKAYDDVEMERSANTLRTCAEWFVEFGVRAAIESIRAAETSVTHTVADARRYIEEVDHPGVAHINGDGYHMQSEESHIGEAIREQQMLPVWFFIGVPLTIYGIIILITAISEFSRPPTVVLG